MNWTPDQQKAISAKNGTLLVSAAAGSGKTAVLVERVLTRLEDAENGCKADELLIVTFTKAATAQMREKISKELSKRIAQNPRDSHLLRQQSLLPFAQISTIDSLCGDIVRENFQKLGIEPDYKIADDRQLSTLKQESAAEVLEAFFAQGDNTFRELSELLFSGRDDQKLIETILSLNDVASSYPNPEEWLHSLYTNYLTDAPLTETVFGKLAMEQGLRMVEDCIADCDGALAVVDVPDSPFDKYIEHLSEIREALQPLKESVESGSFAEIKEAIEAVKPVLSKRTPSVKGESFEKDFVKIVKDRVKKCINEKFPALFCSTEEEYEQDRVYILPLIQKMSEAVLAFREILMQKKKELNCYDFSDISFFALQCLQDENGEKSLFAKEMSQRFCEILVDEFQDVNKAQHRLFELLSKDGNNLFYVGDAKQSIYKFRQARPDIFIGLKKEYPLYRSENYPAVIQLDANFRSRRGVTEWVNYTFRQLMYATGKGADQFDILYDTDEYLRASAVYPENDSPEAELHILEHNKERGDRFEGESRYIARYILSQIEDGLQVSDGNGGMRRAKFGDFCILLRSDSGRMTKMAKIFAEHGIPSQVGAKDGFFEAPEVGFVLSLLSVLDNPHQDVPLMAVLLSPVFGFTTDDLVALRLQDRDLPLYNLVRMAAETDTRYEAFLATLADYRTLASTLSVSALIRRLVDDTSYFAIAGAMTAGEGRKANLNLLERFAGQYEQTGRIGLSGFMRFLETLKEQGTKVEQATTAKNSLDMVQIMTIHRSKGLEFPVCILANCMGAFNDDEYKQKYIIHNTYGMATVRRDTGRFVEYNTVPKKVLTRKVRDANLNEELRILYVAMTRAKEKLVAVLCDSGMQKHIAALATRVIGREQIGGEFDMNCYGDWILTTAMRHPDAHALREWAELPGALLVQEADFPLYVHVSATPEADVYQPQPMQWHQARENVLRNIREKTSYVYPYAPLSVVTAKHAASEMQQGGINRNFFATSIPAFMNQGGLTPAHRGTVLHRFMQYASYPAAAKDAQEEANRLLSEGIFTRQEVDVLPLSAVETFFQSPLGQRILDSAAQFREQRFAIEVGVRTLYPDLPESMEEETVVIQGMVDCAFVEDGKLYIVDYKTDREDANTLRVLYKTQLSVYRMAMEKCMSYPIGGVYLYSFHNGTAIDME